jgi:tripartite-type tricarboxylate transporter receptor subunit TctC
MPLCPRPFLLLAMALIAAAPARAENYPARPVHIITPFPPGPTDAVARLFAQRASEEWKQPVVVENRAGATGTIGTEQVVKAVPDGYTLLFTVDLPITMAPALMKLRYDPQADLAALGEVARVDNVLMVNARSGIHSLSELIAAAKAKPGTLTFASSGNAAPAHLCGEMLKAAAGIDLIHVPYSGAAPAMNALLAGDVTAFCGPIPQGAPHIAAKTAIALGVTSETESAFLPGVPSLAARYPNLVISAWLALFAPSRTPSPVTEALRAELHKVFADAEMQTKLASLSTESEWVTGGELAQKIARDTAKWKEVIESAHIRAN